MDHDESECTPYLCKVKQVKMEILKRMKKNQLIMVASFK